MDLLVSYVNELLGSYDNVLLFSWFKLSAKLFFGKLWFGKTANRPTTNNITIIFFKLIIHFIKWVKTNYSENIHWKYGTIFNKASIFLNPVHSIQWRVKVSKKWGFFSMDRIPNWLFLMIEKSD